MAEERALAGEGKMSERKFSVGDRVRVNAPYSELHGEEFTVISDLVGMPPSALAKYCLRAIQSESSSDSGSTR